jgi:1-acyl-sn-glycerol-3-phosphate acyltransferase
MTTLRSLAYFIFLVLSTIFYAAKILIITPWQPFAIRSKIANQWGIANMYALKLLCNLDYKIIGAENLPHTNCIVMANHQSAWETIAWRGIIPPEQSWVLKQELLSIPFLGWALWALQAIAIDRTSGTKALKQVIKQGTSALQQGRWVMIFPEGTRVAAGERKKYNSGGAMLAEKSGYPILPIAHNAGLFWPRKGLYKKPGTIQVVIGPVITPQGKTVAQINNEVENWINGQVEKLLNQ